MSECPLISVLVPLYNHERYLSACLQSIADSRYPRLEVLVLDDGSRDGSLAACLAWRDAHPGVFERFEIQTQPNAGITRTLNRLVASARGDYLALLASDDCLLPDGLRLRAEALAQHPQWLAVFGDSQVIDAEGRLTHASGLTQLYPNSARPGALIRPELIRLELILRWSVPGPGLMLRRRAFDPVSGVGAYDETMVVEDRDFYLRLLTRDALGYIDVAVAAYRFHGANSVRSESARLAQLDSLARAGLKSARETGWIDALALRLDVARIRATRDLWSPLRRTAWDALQAWQSLRLRWAQWAS